MIVKQISAFIENRKGRLTEIADILAKNNIDISALSLADAAEYGVLRMIVNDSKKAKEVLGEMGIIAKVTDTLAVAIDDQPGGFANALHILTDNEVEIKYMYACISHENGKALMILSVEDVEAAEALINNTDAGRVSPSKIYRF